LDVSTGGGDGGGGAARVATPNVPFIPSRACPGTEHRKRNDPLRGNETVIVWRSAGRRIRVRRPLTTKSWFVLPRFITTNRTAEPAGTDLRERVKAKSRASTRTVMVLELAATVDPGSSAQAERATLVVASETTTHPLGTTVRRLRARQIGRLDVLQTS
jgi:hypothetical protein